MTKQARIEKNVLTVLSGIEYTILKALIDLYPEYRFREPNGPQWFTMIIPKDLNKHLDLKISAFHVYINKLVEKKFLTRKWVTDRGVAVEINFFLLQEFEDGVPGRFSWRRKVKELISAAFRLVRRALTWKPKSGTPQN